LGKECSGRRKIFVGKILYEKIMIRKLPDSWSEL